MPDLFVENWSQIFSHLKSSLPPPGSACDWSLLHQSGLAGYFMINEVTHPLHMYLSLLEIETCELIRI